MAKRRRRDGDSGIGAVLIIDTHGDLRVCLKVNAQTAIIRYQKGDEDLGRERES
jgi:hypothetical protein